MMIKLKGGDIYRAIIGVTETKDERKEFRRR